MSHWWESTLLRRERVARETVACVLRRPPGFEFRAGQYVEMMLLSPAFTDALGPSRAMSIASAPSDEEIVILMRLRDTAFKRSITALSPGEPLLLDGPIDDLPIGGRTGGAVALLAGGVGVAPFRSFLRETAAFGRRLAGTLFYSNRRPEDAAYLDELATLSASIGLQFMPTMTQMATSAREWPGATERLSGEMVDRCVPRSCDTRYYVSGSTLFVSGLCYDLEQRGVPPRAIAVEMYAGY